MRVCLCILQCITCCCSPQPSCFALAFHWPGGETLPSLMREPSNLLCEKLLTAATRVWGCISVVSQISASLRYWGSSHKTSKINLQQTGPCAPTRKTCITQLWQWYLLVCSQWDSQPVSSSNELLPVWCFRAEEGSSRRGLISEDVLGCLSESKEEEGRIFIFFLFLCPTQSDQRWKSLHLMKEEQGN